MKNRLKTAALSFGVAILFGSAVIGCAGTDSVEKTRKANIARLSRPLLRPQRWLWFSPRQW